MANKGFAAVLISLLLITPCCFAELIDPTQPPPGYAPGDQASATNKLELTAIFDFDQRSVAVINGQIVHVGDRVANYEVTKINQLGVELQGPGGTINLPLLPIGIKTPAFGKGTAE